MKKSPELAEPERFRTEDCAHFFRTYRALQDETKQIVPPRKSLNLRSIPSVAPYLAIFELKDPSQIIVRLVGTGFVLRTGIDNTGQNALEMLPPELRDWTREHFRRIVEVPCGSICVSREAYGDAHLLTEVISLPFADSSGKASLVVSASIPFERPEFSLPREEMTIGGFFDVSYFDIGAGTGTDTSATPLRR